MFKTRQHDNAAGPEPSIAFTWIVGPSFCSPSMVQTGATFGLAVISIGSSLKPRASQRCRNNCLTLERKMGPRQIFGSAATAPPCCVREAGMARDPGRKVVFDIDYCPNLWGPRRPRRGGRALRQVRSGLEEPRTHPPAMRPDRRHRGGDDDRERCGRSFVRRAGGSRLKRRTIVLSGGQWAALCSPAQSPRRSIRACAAPASRSASATAIVSLCTSRPTWMIPCSMTRLLCVSSALVHPAQPSSTCIL
jgi:hypothetical protein